MPKSTPAAQQAKTPKNPLTEEEKRRKNQIWAWTDLKTGGNTLNLIFKNTKNRSYKLPKVVEQGKSWTIVINADSPNRYLRAIWKFIQTVYPLLVWFDVQRLRGRENDNAYLECEIAKSIHLMTTDQLDSPDRPKPHSPPDWSNKHKSPQLVSKMMVKHIRKMINVPNTIPIPDFDVLEVIVQAVMFNEKKEGEDSSENIVLAEKFNDCGQSALYFALRLKCELVTSELTEENVNLANLMFSVGKEMAPLFNFSTEKCKVCLESELHVAQFETTDLNRNKSVILLTNLKRQKTGKCLGNKTEKSRRKLLVLTETPVGRANKKLRRGRRYLKSFGSKSRRNRMEEKIGDTFYPIGSICNKTKNQLYFFYKADNISSRGFITRTLVDNILKIKTHRVFFRKNKAGQFFTQRNQKKEAICNRRNIKSSKAKKDFKKRAEEKARQKASQLRREAEIEAQNQKIIEELMKDGLTSKRIVKIFERNRGTSDESCVNQTLQSQRSLRDNQNKNYKEKNNCHNEDKEDKEYIPLVHENKKFKRLENSKKNSRTVIEKQSNIVAPAVKVLMNKEPVRSSKSSGTSVYTKPFTPDEVSNQAHMEDKVIPDVEENIEENPHFFEFKKDDLIHELVEPTLELVSVFGDLPQSQVSKLSSNFGHEDEKSEKIRWDSPMEEPSYSFSLDKESGKFQQETLVIRAENGTGDHEDSSMEVEQDCAVTSSNDISTKTFFSTSLKNVLNESNSENTQSVKAAQNLVERQIVPQQHAEHVHSPDSDYHSATDSTVSPELLDVAEAGCLNRAAAENPALSSGVLLEETNCAVANSVNSSLKRNRLDSFSNANADSSLNVERNEPCGEPRRPKRPYPQTFLPKHHVDTSMNGELSKIAKISSVASNFLGQPWCEKAVQDGQISHSDSEQAALMIGMWSVMPNPAKQLEELTNSLMEKQKAEEESVRKFNKQKEEEEKQRLTVEHLLRQAEELAAENARKESERNAAAERQQQEMAQILNLHVSNIHINHDLLLAARQIPVPTSGRTPHPMRLPQLEQEEAGHPILRVQNRHVVQQPVQHLPMIHAPSPNPLHLLQNIAFGITPTPPHFLPGQQPVIAPIPIRIAPPYPVVPPSSVTLPNFGLQINPAIFNTTNFNQPFPFTPETLAFIQQYNGFQ